MINRLDIWRGLTPNYILLTITSAFLVFISSLPNLQAAQTASVPMYALVIGNSSYDNKPLTNPKQDANLMADTLNEVGFKVKLVNDLDRKSFFTNVRQFYKSLPKDSVALPICMPWPA